MSEITVMHEKNEFNQLIGHPVENWSPIEKPSKKIMHGHYCRLEMLDIEKHATQLFNSLLIDNLGESWTYLPYGPFASSVKFCDWLKEKSLQDDIVFYTILDFKKNLPIGLASFLRIDREHGVIEVGHLHFSKLLKKSSAATEAMYLMMQYVFEELKYRRYEWKCDSLNQPSRRAAERLGFKFEGIFRQSVVYKNRNRDTAWYSIIDSEWPEIKARFQKWLSQSNFDITGVQLLSLWEC